MKNACITTLSKKRANYQIVRTVDHKDTLEDVQEKDQRSIHRAAAVAAFNGGQGSPTSCT